MLLATDTWGTVSCTYQQDITHSSALAPLLRRFPQPFSSPNGVLVFEKKMKYAGLATHTHNTAKLFVQEKYFGAENLAIPLLVFVGRITEQKGVHLICEVAEELIVSCNRNIQIIVGGIANDSDPYGRYCMSKMEYLRTYYGDCFWVAGGGRRSPLGQPARVLHGRLRVQPGGGLRSHALAVRALRHRAGRVLRRGHAGDRLQHGRAEGGALSAA